MMEKSIILGFSLLFCLLSLSLSAQNKGTLSYVYTINDGMTSSKRIQNLIVYFNGTQSIEFPFNKSKKDQTEIQGTNSTFKSVDLKADRGTFLYKDFKKVSFFFQILFTLEKHI